MWQALYARVGTPPYLNAAMWYQEQRLGLLPLQRWRRRPGRAHHSTLCLRVALATTVPHARQPGFAGHVARVAGAQFLAAQGVPMTTIQLLGTRCARIARRRPAATRFPVPDESAVSAEVRYRVLHVKHSLTDSDFRSPRQWRRWSYGRSWTSLDADEVEAAHRLKRRQLQGAWTPAENASLPAGGATLQHAKRQVRGAPLYRRDLQGEPAAPPIRCGEAVAGRTFTPDILSLLTSALPRGFAGDACSLALTLLDCCAPAHALL